MENKVTQRELTIAILARIICNKEAFISRSDKQAAFENMQRQMTAATNRNITVKNKFKQTRGTQAMEKKLYALARKYKGDKRQLEIWHELD